MLDLGLGGKVAIITGGSEGLGRAAAERLAAEGARVAICARRPDVLEGAAAGIRKAGGQVLARPVDVTKAEQLDTFVNEVVREFAEEAEEMAGRRKVTLDLRLGRGESAVRGDRNMLRRVLVNLVQNALDVSPQGARILLSTRRLLHRVRLSVRDRGPGVSAEALPHLFQPFFSTKERGTGLGLYLSREIVMAHDGEVALRTVKPSGAQATVLLPRWREGEAHEWRRLGGASGAFAARGGR